MARQLAFTFAHAPSYAPEDFLPTDASREALAWIDHWPEAWPRWGLVLAGPSGAGKTHLAHRWAAQSGACWLSEADLRGNLAQTLQRHRRWVIDGLEPFLSPPQDEPLLHFLNLLAEVEGHALITAADFPSRLFIPLPDLASRLRMLPAVALPLPDEAALAQLTLKWLHDRQWQLSQDALATLLSTAERTPGGIQHALLRLEQAMEQSPARRLTPAFIRQQLSPLTGAAA